MKKTTRILAVLLCVLMLAAGCAQVEEPQATGDPSVPEVTPEGEQGGAAGYTPGTYTATTIGMNADVTVEVTVSEDKIESVVVTNHMETPGIGSVAVEKIPAAIVEE